MFVLCSSGCGADSEIYRIRVRNSKGGLVQVSLDKGETWTAVGRVLSPSIGCKIGFPAATYTDDGCVAATAVHGIRIKVRNTNGKFGKAGDPQIFSIAPKEFSVIPKGFGGHIPGTTAIQTDIHTGVSLFREFAPYSGSKVYLESDGNLIPIAKNYSPKDKDALVIVVNRPEKNITALEFDNKVGGKALAVYDDGREEVLADVVRAMSSAGRYDATTFTGVGLINTNHGGVITISTAPVCSFNTVEGGPVETRGGFMIQPYDHVMEQREFKTQVMVLRGLKKLEGTSPLFGKYISLHPDCFAQVKRGRDEWEPVPQRVGKLEGALADVTAVRINLPDWDEIDLAPVLERSAAAYNREKKAVPTGTTMRSSLRCDTVVFYVDGKRATITNAAPFEFTADKGDLAPGYHEIVAENADDASVKEIKYIFVK